MDYLWAFLIGGGICAVAQIIINYTKLTPAKILVSLVIIGVLLYAFGWYAPFAEFAKAGVTVPLLGFGGLLAKGTEEAVREHGLSGVLTGGFTATAAGIAAAIIFGFLAAVIFKSKDKS